MMCYRLQEKYVRMFDLSEPSVKIRLLPSCAQYLVDLAAFDNYQVGTLKLSPLLVAP